MSKKLGPGLYVVATPIGNLGDMTLRAIEVLKGVDVIACEDTRVSGKLLRHFDIPTKSISYHDHNADKVLPRLLERLGEGQSVALISDAGTPLISDPGYRLVSEVQKQGITVSALPGASALLAALACAGLPTDRFMFAGFLPNKTTARQKALAGLKKIGSTLIFYESPKRLAACLKDMTGVLGQREAVVCRELTKLYEEVRRGTLEELCHHYENSPTPKGEVVVLVGPSEEEMEQSDLDEALESALKQLSLREAVAAVTYITGRRRKQVYARALELAG